jgi:hypothetical protein
VFLTTDGNCSSIGRGTLGDQNGRVCSDSLHGRSRSFRILRSSLFSLLSELFRVPGLRLFEWICKPAAYPFESGMCIYLLSKSIPPDDLDVFLSLPHDAHERGDSQKMLSSKCIIAFNAIENYNRRLQLLTVISTQTNPASF